MIGVVVGVARDATGVIQLALARRSALQRCVQMLVDVWWGARTAACVYLARGAQWFLFYIHTANLAETTTHCGSFIILALYVVVVQPLWAAGNWL